MRLWSFLPVVSLCGVFVAAQPATAQTYSITDLGTLPGDNGSLAYAIDELGNVTGVTYNNSLSPANLPGQPFLYHDGKLVNLRAGSGFVFGAGFGIADGYDRDHWGGEKKVRVTGVISDDEGNMHAFLYEDHFMRDLGFLPGGSVSTGYGVNSLGHVAGLANGTSGILQAVLFKDGNVINLGTFSGTGGGDATAINNHDDVTGTADVANGNNHAFLYHDGKLTDLGVLPGGALSGGTGINDSLQIAGSSTIAGGFYHAFLWSKGKMTDLGLLPTGNSSNANAINAWGQVVGTATVYTPGSGVETPGSVIDYYTAHAFVFTGGKMYDLNDLVEPNSGWLLQAATGINDRGQISGQGMINGETHGFLLTLDCGQKQNRNTEACRYGH